MLQALVWGRSGPFLRVSMLDVGTGGQSSSTEWLREEQQLCLRVAAPIRKFPIRNSRSEIPDQLYSCFLLEGWASKPGLLPTGKAAWEGFPAWKFLKGKGNGGSPEEGEEGRREVGIVGIICKLCS